ncbi:MAG: PAS domain-containing protein [Bacteroidetes bacterium]|nr:PAS domain-containing protein [Bacteroidota bacterium]
MPDTIQEEHFSEHKIITQLFDTQPDSVVWFIPKFAANKLIPVDFEVGYCNTAACSILNGTKTQILGSLLRSSALIDEGSRNIIWQQCLDVWLTGNYNEFTYFSPGMDKHFHVQRSKIQNGILSITRDHTKFIKNQEEKELQSKLLNQIIESSSSGICLYESIRNREGNIIDFKLKVANERSAEITSFTLEELYKYTVKELMIIRGQSNLFEVVSNVVETGDPVYMEYFAVERKQWIAFSIKKFNDGYLLNYIDITVTKNLEEKARHQANMLTGIINTSITGLITLEAVYDFSGKVEDFNFVLLNNAAEKILGIKNEDKNKSYLTLFPGSRSNGFFDLYLNVLTTGIPVTKEFFYKGEGYNGWYFISVSKMNDSTLVQSFADITNNREIKS